MTAQADRDSAVASALSAVRSIATALPEVTEKDSWSTNFQVAGKTFAQFVDDHHGDNRLALWCKGEPGAQGELVALDAERFYVPPYSGARGWVGARLDIPPVDWEQVAGVLLEAYRLTAPKRLAAAVTSLPPFDTGAIAWQPDGPLPPQAELQPELLERLRAICLGLPETTEEEAFGQPVFRVRGKSFADYHAARRRGHRAECWCKATLPGQAELVELNPDWFFVPPYIGPRGWVGIRLDAPDLDWAMTESVLRAAYRLAAPKRLAALVDRAT
jgi:hypothetical protein